MIPLALYGIRVIAIANVGNFIVGAMMMGITVFLPTFIQGAMGRSAVVAGSVLGAVFIGWMCGSNGGARAQLRFSYRVIAIAGSIFVVIGSASLTVMDAASNLTGVYAGMVLLGLGFGSLNSVYVVSTQAAVTWEQRGAATSSLVFMRQIGSAIGSAAFAAVFNTGIYGRIPDAGSTVARLVDPEQRRGIPALDLARDASAIAQSLHGIYVILFCLAAVIGGLVFTLPRHLRAAHAVQPQGVQTG
jgi:MFS family permease